MKFAVVGGGITGLSIAYRLAAEGEAVTLYERSSRLGGLIGSFRIADVWLEKYFHHIFLSDTAIRRRIAEVDLEKDLLWKVTPMAFYGAAKIHRFDGPVDLLRFSVLPFIDRIRFGLRTLQAGYIKNGLQLDSLTAKEWVENSWGGSIYERFWGPLLASKFGDAADSISAAWLWGRIFARANSRKLGKERLGYLRGGFIRLIEEMSRIARNRGAEIRLHQEVKRVEKSSATKWIVATQADRVEYDTVVLSIPSPYIGAVCPDLPPAERAAYADISYVAISCMPIVMDRPLSGIYWLNVGDASIPFTGVIEQTNFVPKEDYGGMHVAYLFNYLPQKHPWLFEPKDLLFTRYEEGLKRMFPDYRREHVKEIFLFRDPYANVIYEKNYLSKRPPIASGARGLFYANTAHIFPDDRNQNYSIELADRVVGEMNGFR